MIEVNQGLAVTCRVFDSVLWDGPFVRGSVLGALKLRSEGTVLGRPRSTST